MVPTFLGSTVLVFVILQIAPGGPIEKAIMELQMGGMEDGCLLYTSPSPRDRQKSRMPSSA